MQYIYPLLLKASLHETIWGGRELEYAGLKQLPPGNIRIGEAWETEISSVVQNGEYTGKKLGEVVNELGSSLLGERVLELYGKRFPLLAKFTDIATQVSIHVHPHDVYAAQHEHNQLGKTEFWYILAAEPGATFVHGFKSTTSYLEVRHAISENNLDILLYECPIYAGDVILIPAGTVHTLRGGVLFYEMQEYSDLTYRIYDYGRLNPNGSPRALHVDRALDVLSYHRSPQIKAIPVTLVDEACYEDQCLVACEHFLTRKLHFKQLQGEGGAMSGRTKNSCILLSSLGASVRIWYGTALEHSETLSKGQTAVLPASLGYFRIEGIGSLLYSYVPAPDDEAWQRWEAHNR